MKEKRCSVAKHSLVVVGKLCFPTEVIVYIEYISNRYTSKYTSVLSLGICCRKWWKTGGMVS